MRPRLQARREGLALPMAILLIGFITAGVIGAFGRMQSETRTLDGARTTTVAFSVAQRGLEARVANGDTLPDSVRYVFPDGTADVRVTRIRGGVGVQDTTVWLVRATGTAKGGRPGRPAARRSVAQLAVLAAGTIDANAAWTSLSGLRKNGGSGLISGVNECDPSQSVAGAAVPLGMFELKSTGQNPMEGTPPVSESGSQTSFASSVSIDWASLKNPGGAVTPDVVVCPGGDGYSASWAPMCTSWPTFTDPNSYPTVLVNGSITLQGGMSGQGLLIVTGRLTFTGGQETWKGLILVGQELIDNGTGSISGAVISGLDIKLGLDVAESEVIEEAVANGTKSYRYNSCEIAKALKGAATMSLFPNTWIDNWMAW